MRTPEEIRKAAALLIEVGSRDDLGLPDDFKREMACSGGALEEWVLDEPTSDPIKATRKVLLETILDDIEKSLRARGYRYAPDSVGNGS